MDNSFIHVENYDRNCELDWKIPHYNIIVHSMIAAPIYQMIVTTGSLLMTGCICYFNTLLSFFICLIIMLCFIDYNMKEVLLV